MRVTFAIRVGLARLTQMGGGGLGSLTAAGMTLLATLARKIASGRALLFPDFRRVSCSRSLLQSP